MKRVDALAAKGVPGEQKSATAFAGKAIKPIHAKRNGPL
jgi:hypothetical protein